jgi:hypothetical protein
MPQGGAIFVFIIFDPGSRFFLVFAHFCATCFTSNLYERKRSIYCFFFGTNPSFEICKQILRWPKPAVGHGGRPLEGWASSIDGMTIGGPF